jgi:hypothetical protein
MGDCQLAELGVIRIASPCTVPWSSMNGTDAVRFCGQCKLKVYNVEHLTSYEVRDLLLKTEGRVCMRLFKRFDGTVLTQDCPTGLAAFGQAWRQSKQRVSGLGWVPMLATAAIALLTLFVFGTWFFGDNIRRAFGMGSTMGALAGDVNIAERKPNAADPRDAVFARYGTNRPVNQYGGPRP